MVQPQDRAAARAARENAGQADFSQLEQAIAEHGYGSQLVLGFDVEERYLPLVQDIKHKIIKQQIEEIRDFAESRGEKILFENLSCQQCGSEDVIRELGKDGCGSPWIWECRSCHKRVDDGAATQQMIRLFDARRATSSNQPNQDLEKGIEVFSTKDIEQLAENLRTVSSSESASDRYKATLKRLLNIGTVRPCVVPNAAWQGQLDELRENFPNFVDAVDEAIEPSFAIAAAGGRARAAPLLLVGPPGVGKTFFTSMLASLLETPSFKVCWRRPETEPVLRVVPK